MQAVPAPEGFERVEQVGRAAVLAGDHRIEADRVTTRRWGPSAVLLPSGDLAASLDTLTSEVLSIAGDGHWPSAAWGGAHVTVRALEPFDPAGMTPGRRDRYAAAIRRAVEGTGPVTLRFRGLVTAVGTVMVCAHTPDGSADRLRHRLGEELGVDGWLERDAVARDPIWYCSLVHFAGPIREPKRLVDWTAERHDLVVGTQTFDDVSLCEWAFDGARMTPVGHRDR